MFCAFFPVLEVPQSTTHTHTPTVYNYKAKSATLFRDFRILSSSLPGAVSLQVVLCFPYLQLEPKVTLALFVSYFGCVAGVALSSDSFTQSPQLQSKTDWSRSTARPAPGRIQRTPAVKYSEASTWKNPADTCCKMCSLCASFAGASFARSTSSTLCGGSVV